MSLRISTTLVLLAILAVLAPVRGAPTPLLNVRHEGHEDNASPASSFEKQNALDAQKLNVQFTTLKATDSCKDGELACMNSSFAQCANGKWTLTPCASSTVCVALPLVNKAGTNVVCDSKEDAIARFEAAGVNGGITGNDQNSGTGPTSNDDGANEDANDDDDGECDTDDGDDEGDDNDGDENDQDCDGQGDDESPESTKLPATSTPAKETVTVTVTPTIAPASTTAASSSVSAGTTILLNSPAKPSSSASAEPSAAITIKLNRRQFTGVTFPVSTGAATSVVQPSVTASPSPPANTVVPSITTTAIPSVPPTNTVVAPVATVTVTAGSASTTSITRVDPTAVVLGPDGLRTVTVVSTVTVGCGASTGLPALSSAPVSATIVASSIPAVPQPVSSSASVPAPITITLNSPAPASSASSIASSSPSTNTIVSPTTTSVGGGAGGFSFSTAPSPTAAPGNVNIGDANNGAGSDFSKLLTATVG